MNKTTPRDFHNAFIAVMQSEKDDFRAAVGFEPKSYKYFMRSTMYPKIARHLGLSSWNKEYYTLDGMLYEERGTDETGKYATYANWISVAIEHENDSSRPQETMNKLQLLNAPLKVLITYAALGAVATAEKQARAEKQPARQPEKSPAPHPNSPAASLYQSPDSPATHERSP